MGWVIKILKIFLFMFSVVCGFFALVTVIGVTWALRYADENEQGLCIVLIIIGSLFFLISFFGCFGAVLENKYLLWTYAGCMLIIIILNIAITFGYIMKWDAKKDGRNQIEAAWEERGTNLEMMKYEILYKCCGKDGPDDYENEQIPKSCYDERNDMEENLYRTGCIKKAGEVTEKSQHIFTIVNYISLACMILAFVCALVLALLLDKERRTESI